MLKSPSLHRFKLKRVGRQLFSFKTTEAEDCYLDNSSSLKS